VEKEVLDISHSSLTLIHIYRIFLYIHQKDIQEAGIKTLEVHDV